MQTIVWWKICINCSTQHRMFAFTLIFLTDIWCGGVRIALGIETNMRKMWYRKARRFLHWFFHGSGMVLGSFFYVFLEWKFGRSPKIDLAKKLTKHWPWRQNRGSVFWKYYKFLRKYGSKSQLHLDFDLTCFLAWFSEVWGSQNHRFLHVGHRFLPVNFDWAELCTLCDQIWDPNGIRIVNSGIWPAIN